jgi:hypothetical protein
MIFKLNEYQIDPFSDEKLIFFTLSVCVFLLIELCSSLLVGHDDVFVLTKIFLVPRYIVPKSRTSPKSWTFG